MDDETIWASGAFVHGGVVGILNNTKKYPRRHQVFLDYLKQQCPGSSAIVSQRSKGSVQSPIVMHTTLE